MCGARQLRRFPFPPSPPLASRALPLSPARHFQVSGLELRKIWKGLFFCMWHADKQPVQVSPRWARAHRSVCWPALPVLGEAMPAAELSYLDPANRRRASWRMGLGC